MFRLLIILLFIGCKNNKEVSPTKELKHSREWIEYIYNNGYRNQLEIYTDKKGDTLVFQKKTFLNDSLIRKKSMYYELNYHKTPFDTIVGRITLYDNLDHKIINPITSRTLEIDIINYKNKDSLIFDFQSNENYIDFKYKSKSDTISGLIYQTITIDKGNKKTRIITIALPIDNKYETNNFWVDSIEDIIK